MTVGDAEKDASLGAPFAMLHNNNVDTGKDVPQCGVEDDVGSFYYCWM